MFVTSSNECALEDPSVRTRALDECCGPRDTQMATHAWFISKAVIVAAGDDISCRSPLYSWIVKRDFQLSSQEVPTQFGALF